MHQSRFFDGVPTGAPRDTQVSVFYSPADFWIDFAKGVIISTTLFCILVAAMWSPKDPDK